MNDKRKVTIAWILGVICLIGAAANTSIWAWQLTGRPSLTGAVGELGWALVIPLVFAGLALLIISRQPGSRVGWLLMIIVLAAANPLSTGLEYLSAAPVNITPGLWLLLWFDIWSWVPLIFPIFLIPLHFPTGRPPSSRWKWVNYLAIGLWVFLIVIAAFNVEIGPLNGDWVMLNPIGFIPVEVINGPILIGWGIGLLTILSASVFSLYVRYRHARPGERQQIKWLLYAGAFFGVFYGLVYFLSSAGQFGSVSGWLNLLLILSILAFPIAITITILRYRLYDIDVIIRKTLVWRQCSLS